MRTGNVVRAPGEDGGLWIVTEVDDETVQAVAFDAENVSAVQCLKDTTRKERCPECDEDGHPDCHCCHGSKIITYKIPGWKRATVLAPNVQAFIMDRIKRVLLA